MILLIVNLNKILNYYEKGNLFSKILVVCGFLVFLFFFNVIGKDVEYHYYKKIFTYFQNRVEYVDFEDENKNDVDQNDLSLFE